MRLATAQQMNLPSHSCRLMHDLLADAGFDACAAAGNARIRREALEDVSSVVTGLQELNFQREFFLQTAERPDLWIELGRRYRLLSMGHMCYALAMTTAPDLRAMVSVAEQFGDLHYTLADTRVLLRDGEPVGFRSLYGEMPDQVRQFTMIKGLAVASAVLRDIWQGSLPLAQVVTAVSSRYERFVRPLFGSIPVSFDSPLQSTDWYWTREVAAQPLPLSNLSLHALYQRECEDKLRLAASERGLLEQVEDLVVTGRFQLSQAEAAEKLFMTPRTLQRKLAAYGLTFMDIVRRQRYLAACDFLQRGAATIEEIAWRLGYRNISGFVATFKAQAGLSPAAYRRFHCQSLAS